jgi:hypothetical protein
MMASSAHIGESSIDDLKKMVEIGEIEQRKDNRKRKELRERMNENLEKHSLGRYGNMSGTFPIEEHHTEWVSLSLLERSDEASDRLVKTFIEYEKALCEAEDRFRDWLTEVKR